MLYCSHRAEWIRNNVPKDTYKSRHGVFPWEKNMEFKDNVAQGKQGMGENNGVVVLCFAVVAVFYFSFGLLVLSGGAGWSVLLLLLGVVLLGVSVMRLRGWV